MISARGSGRIAGQVTSVSGAGCVQLCGHAMYLSLNPAGYLEFPDRTVGDRPAQQAPLRVGSDFANPSIFIGSDHFFINKKSFQGNVRPTNTFCLTSPSPKTSPVTS